MPAKALTESRSAVPTWILDFVLKSEENYTGRRHLHVRNVTTVVGMLAFLVLVGMTYNDILNDREATAKGAQFSPAVILSRNAPVLDSSKSIDSFAGQFGGGGGAALIGRDGRGVPRQGQVTRTHSAPQVILPGQTGDSGPMLPMASRIPVKLTNVIQSGSTESPVIAEVTQDVIARGTVAISSSTRAVGEALVDRASQRIQIHFHMLIDPDGGEHAIDALAMMPDGSAGLEGDYHSGTAVRVAGQFLGTFIGGMAQGMTEFASGGMMGGPYEVGSLKNGILTGVSETAQSQAQGLGSDLSESKPTMSLPAGKVFTLYLEKGYSP